MTNASLHNSSVNGKLSNNWQFIRAATGLEIDIGGELEPCTRNISIIKLSDRSRCDHDIVLIDTPGFDTLKVSEADILKLVSDWLKTTWVYPLH
jgi:hypothetical protein